MPHQTGCCSPTLCARKAASGEVLAEIFTDFPQSFAERKQLFLRPPQAVSSTKHYAPVRVESHRLHKGRVVLKFVPGGFHQRMPKPTGLRRSDSSRRAAYASRSGCGLYKRPAGDESD